MAEIKLDKAMGAPMPTLIEMTPDHDATGAGVRHGRLRGTWKASKSGRTGTMTYQVPDGVYEAEDRYGRTWYIVEGGDVRKVTEDEARAAL